MEEVLVLTYSDTDEALEHLLAQMRLVKFKPSVVYGVSRGGIPVGIAVAQSFGVPFKILSPYTKQEFETNALVVDDIYDSGATLEHFKAQGAVYTAALYVRPGKESSVSYFGRTSASWLKFPWETDSDEKGGMKQAISTLLREVGENPLRSGLAETPARVEKALKELTAGYGTKVEDLFKTFDSEKYDGIVLLKDIPYYSLCEHHMLPFWGKATVAYIPQGRIVGLSKMARVVEAYAQRLQVQERMTQQIADAIKDNLAPLAVAVIVEGQHLCMRMRGVEKEGLMKTSCLQGAFRTDAAARKELFDLLQA